MRDLMPDLTSSDAERVAESACCPGGTCGPIFETPLLELALNSIRDFVRNQKAGNPAEATPANPPLDQVLSAVPAMAGPSPRLLKDAPHD